MTINISGFGLQIGLVASVTFPAAIILTQFSDDGDALDIQNLDIADTAMGLNGDLLIWNKANPIKATINIVADSDDDQFLDILLTANRVAKGKNSARDIITLTANYPSGKIITLTNGTLTTGIPGISVASAGRFKTKPYAFAFENAIGT
jgi:hypothetical protein